MFTPACYGMYCLLAALIISGTLLAGQLLVSDGSRQIDLHITAPHDNMSGPGTHVHMYRGTPDPGDDKGGGPVFEAVYLELGLLDTYTTQSCGRLAIDMVAATGNYSTSVLVHRHTNAVWAAWQAMYFPFYASGTLSQVIHRRVLLAEAFQQTFEGFFRITLASPGFHPDFVWAILRLEPKKTSRVFIVLWVSFLGMCFVTLWFACLAQAMAKAWYAATRRPGQNSRGVIGKVTAKPRS